MSPAVTAPVGTASRPRKRRDPISTGSDWTFELIETYFDAIKRTAARFGLDTYPVQLELISAEQMLDAVLGKPPPRSWSRAVAASGRARRTTTSRSSIDPWVDARLSRGPMTSCAMPVAIP